MMNAITRVAEPAVKEEVTMDAPILNMDFFTSGNNNLYLADDTIHANLLNKDDKPKKKRGRKKKMPDGNTVEVEDDQDDSNLSMTQSNASYNTLYDETNGLLKSSIYQIDNLNNDIKSEMDQIKASKTIKRKYDYIANLASTYGTLMSTKIQAIKEINKSTTDCNNLELKRIKELKLNENQKDDNKYIMDMYNAFISTPMGTNYQLGPSASDLSLMTGTNDIVRADIGNSGYNNVGPLTASQNMMRLEQNPNIKTVVVYDMSTGAKYFDVMDISTQQSVPNAERPDPMFLEDTTLDMNNGIARNTNLDTNYPLICINNNVYSEY